MKNQMFPSKTNGRFKERSRLQCQTQLGHRVAVHRRTTHPILPPPPSFFWSDTDNWLHLWLIKICASSSCGAGREGLEGISGVQMNISGSGRHKLMRNTGRENMHQQIIFTWTRGGGELMVKGGKKKHFFLLLSVYRNHYRFFYCFLCWFKQCEFAIM